MREKNRNSIASIEKFPQFTTMNVIDGQAGQIICASLIFYSLTIDNILNIIVLLILAGISISMLSGDNSILQRATDTKQTSERAEAKEQAQMDIMAYVADKTANHQDDSLDDTKIQEILSDNKSYVKTANATSFITKKGEYEIPYSELYTASDTPQIATLPAGIYTAGQEVTFEGEQFFVLENSNASDSTVKLLAKYCLNKTGTEQVNVEYNIYGRAFSKTNYWLNTIPNDPYPYDLQSEEMITSAIIDGDVDSENHIKNAVITARDYGTAKGVTTGRLITYDEADSIIKGSNNHMKNILWGTWTGDDAPVQGYLMFWVGSAETGYETHLVYNVNYVYYYFYGDSNCGIRPVFVVKKDNN